MPDWTKSMQQTFEYYKVDPGTWEDYSILQNVKSASITRDLDSDTLGSAMIDISDVIDECYIRIYLVTIQNGIRERFPLGTFLAQVPSSTFDGKTKSTSLDAFTPLIELKENMPPLGYYTQAGANIMSIAGQLVRENARAPVVETGSSTTLTNPFVSNTNDTWITYVSDLIARADYEFGLDEYGRILFSKKQDAASLTPKWTFTDDNSSILLPEYSLQNNIYDIPNTIEVVYSNGSAQITVTVENNSKQSPISTVNRGRRKTVREVNPNISGIIDEDDTNRLESVVRKYATQRLKDLSTLEYKVSYTHGYCPVNIGDCVLLNYKRAGIDNIKAKVISQSLNCEPGLRVEEVATYTTSLWGD